MAKNGNKGGGKGGGRGDYNRTHHGGGGNSGGNGGKGQSTEEQMEEVIARAVKGAAKYAFGPQLFQNKQDIRAARGHHAVVDRAYDAYAADLGNLQTAQAQAGAQAQQGVTDAATQIASAGGAQTAAAQQQAASQAQLLGQSGQVAGQIGALGAAAGMSRGDAAVRDISQMANVGLARYSDMGRRAATGERDRIEAHAEVRDAVTDLKKQRSEIKHEKGGYMAQAYADFLEQQQQNAIAIMGLRMDRRGDKAAQALDEEQFQLDYLDTIHDNQAQDLAEQHDQQNERHDRHQDRHDDQGDGSGGGTEPDGGDLSPTQREYFNDQVDKVQSAAARIRQIMRSQGVDLGEARRRAQQQEGLEEWSVRIAADLVRGNKLGRASKQAWRAHVPGDFVPEAWR